MGGASVRDHTRQRSKISELMKYEKPEFIQFDNGGECVAEHL